MLEEQARTALLRRLERDPAVVAAWLFGSVARGTDRAGSDVDVAILFDPEPPLLRLLDLQADLCAELRRETQVVSARAAPVDLLHRVFRDGILLVDHDPSRRIRFEVDARNRYFDMRPILMEYRRPRRGRATR